jgi:hypothetical protein
MQPNQFLTGFILGSLFMLSVFIAVTLTGFVRDRQR